MNNRTTIQKELEELNSPLPFEKPVETYSVPAGYFENFAASVLQKLQGQSSVSVNEELEGLSPVLAGISKEMPFTVPQGYFNFSTEGLTSWVKEEEQPQLFSGNKEMPYKVPAGYFENLAGIVLKKANPQEAKVISIGSPRRWMRYAVAALMAGVIAVTSVLYFGQDKSVDPASDSYSWIEKNLKNIPDQELDEFLNTTYTSTPIAKNGSTDKVEVRKLLKDIPNAELDKFIEEISVDTEDASLFN